MTRLAVVAIGLSVVLAATGCGGKPRTWKADKVYEYTPSRLPGAWTDGTRTFEFRRDKSVSWDGVEGTYRFGQDGSLEVRLPGPSSRYPGFQSFKYSVVDDRLIMLSNQTGSWNEFDRK
jgi:hypothetical protein